MRLVRPPSRADVQAMRGDTTTSRGILGLLQSWMVCHFRPRLSSSLCWMRPHARACPDRTLSRTGADVAPVATPDRGTGGAVGAKTTQKTVNAACKGIRMCSGAPDAGQNYCAKLGLPIRLSAVRFLVLPNTPQDSRTWHACTGTFRGMCGGSTTT